MFDDSSTWYEHCLWKLGEGCTIVHWPDLHTSPVAVFVFEYPFTLRTMSY